MMPLTLIEWLCQKRPVDSADTQFLWAVPFIVALLNNDTSAGWQVVDAKNLACILLESNHDLGSITIDATLLNS